MYIYNLFDQNIFYYVLMVYKLNEIAFTGDVASLVKSLFANKAGVLVGTPVLNVDTELKKFGGNTT